MIAQVAGTLVSKDLDRVEVMTGERRRLRAGNSARRCSRRCLVPVRPCCCTRTSCVKEDAWQLYGFSSTFERRVFQRVLNAKGVGPALALGLLSTLTADRLIRAIREKDVPTLQSVPRVGRKKAEQLILDLADKLDDLQVSASSGVRRPEAAGADDAIRALASLGYSMGDAERAVRQAIDDGGQGMGAAELIRSALAKIRG